jgi:DNA (cytosine-5)-methyltransferase 1
MIKVLELFSGYGTASFALKRIGVEHELVGFSDIDKYANQCFQQNHGGKELGDVRKIVPEELQDFDLLTGGFPCQAFSVAGKMQGEVDPRGSLFFEIIRIAEVKKPKWMLLENVKGLTCKKFKTTFDKILSELDRIGYNVYWKVLNSKDFGIPQSRARVWFMCIRKDIDEPLKFQFPEPEPLKIFIKDVLEPQVEAKYYLSEKLQERFAKYLKEKESKIVAMRQREIEQQIEPRNDGCSNSLTSVQKDNLVLQTHRADELRSFDGVCPTLTESHEHKGGTNAPIVVGNGVGINNSPIVVNLQPREGKGIGGKGIISKDDGTVYCVDSANGQAIVENKINVLGILDSEGWEKRHDEIRRIYGTNGIMATLPTGQGGGVIPKIYENATVSNSSPREFGFKEDGISPTILSRDYKDPKIVSTTLTTAVGRIGHSSEELNYIENNMKSGQLRRLTPIECFRLMGFLNDEIKLDGLSDTQRYKLAGNGQDVNMVSKIFKKLLI